MPTTVSAQAEAIDDPAGERRAGAAGQQGEAVDHRHRAAARAEPLSSAGTKTAKVSLIERLATPSAKHSATSSQGT
jgi:hypothetical protein